MGNARVSNWAEALAVSPSVLRREKLENQHSGNNHVWTPFSLPELLFLVTEKSDHNHEGRSNQKLYRTSSNQQTIVGRAWN